MFNFKFKMQYIVLLDLIKKNLDYSVSFPVLLMLHIIWQQIL